MSQHGVGMLVLVAALLFVPPRGVGEPAGPTVLVQPGEPLQSRVDEAASGATIWLAAGVHRGPLVLSRPLILRGQPGAQLRGGGEGSVITISGDEVRVEALEVSGSGRDFSCDDAGVLVTGRGATIQGLRLHDNLHGIYVRRAARATVSGNEVIGLAATHPEPPAVVGHDAHLADEIHHDPPSTQALLGNGIHLFNARRAVVLNNRIHHVRDGIYVAHTSGAEFRGNRIHDSRYGIHYMYSSQNVISENELWRNVAGPALMFSRDLEVSGNILRDHGGLRAYGLLLQNVDMSKFHDNVIIGNRVGVRLQGCSGNAFRGNRIAGNLGGMTMNSSSVDNTWTRNTFGFNLHQVELTGPVPPTEWSVSGVGNRWQGALPLDLNGDGISEWPHHEVDLMGDSRERFPASQLLIGSPGIRALEWALKRAPVPKLRYVTDPHPMVRELRR